LRQVLKSQIISIVAPALLVIFFTSSGLSFSLENCFDSSVNFQWIFRQEVTLPRLTVIPATLKKQNHPEQIKLQNQPPIRGDTLGWTFSVVEN